MIRILHYIPGFEYGGIENVVLNLYMNINKNKFQFDFLVEKEIPEYAKKLIEKNGGKIYQIPKMTKLLYLAKYLYSLYHVFNNNKYEVFHCHSLDTRPFPMMFAKFFHVKVRIMHVHFNNYNKRSFIFVKKLLIAIGQHYSNCYIACSKRAASSVLSKKNNSRVIIINNGIDLNKYKFDNIIRNKIRNSICNNNCFLIGIIGRLSYLKNQEFILKMANKLEKKTRIIFLGDGEDKNKLIRYVKKNKIENAFFLGNVNNVYSYLSAFDLILMPSISEAMPLTIIEAQKNGIPAVVSPAIDDEFIVNSNIQKVELDLNKWLEIITSGDWTRQKSNNNIKRFDITNMTKLYENTIIEFLNEKT